MYPVCFFWVLCSPRSDYFTRTDPLSVLKWLEVWDSFHCRFLHDVLLRQETSVEEDHLYTRHNEFNKRELHLGYHRGNTSKMRIRWFRQFCNCWGGLPSDIRFLERLSQSFQLWTSLAINLLFDGGDRYPFLTLH